MKTFITRNNSLNALKEGLSLMDFDPEVKSILIFACDSDNLTAENCNCILLDISKPLWGGIFPAIINNKEKLDSGYIILGLNIDIFLKAIPRISSIDTDFDKELESFFEKSLSIQTVAVVVDGYSQRISALLDSLFLNLGLDYNFIGGGAGSLKMVQKPCIFSNQGLLKDSAVIVGLNMECSIAVRHGWETIAGPFKITESDRNIVQSIDFKNAFDIYKSIVDEHSGKDLNEKNFFSIAKAYPFGIHKLGAEKVVRDPFFCKSGELHTVGELPTGTFFDILHGKKDTIINAGTSIRKQISHSNDTVLFEIFFDCISRVLFLEDDFTKELEAVNDDNTPLFGALSIGEIANNKKDYLEFYNKTAVLARLKKY